MKFHAWMVALIVCAAGVRAESVTLTPSQDSDIYSFLDRPTSTIPTLGVNASGVGAPHSQRTLIQFNLTPLTIPATEIGTAVMRLYVSDPKAEFGSLVGGNISVLTQTKSWTVTNPTLHWSNLAPGDLQGTLAITSSSADKWVELDVTSQVKAWKAGTTANYGLVLQAESEILEPYLNVAFASMEVPGFQPQLVVTRATAPVVPPVLTIAPGADANQIVLTWPSSNATGWTLEQAASPAGPWTADTTATTTNGSNLQVTHSTADSAAGFFRLTKS